MKKFVFVLSAGMLIVCLAGCGKAETDTVAADSTVKDEAVSEVEETSQESEAKTMAIGNPWKDDVSADEVAGLVNARFIVPDGAENVFYRINESDRLAEMNFNLNGMEFSARMKPTESLEDISGLYYEWADELSGSVAGADAKFRSAVADAETLQNVLWFDKKGMTYSLFTQDKDLDGFDITAVAEAVYQPGMSGE